MSGPSSKKKPPPTQRKCERKLIKARHDQSAAQTEFDIFALRENGEEGVIGGGSFEGVNLENTTAMLTQLAHSLGCELQWERFADLTMEEITKRQHLLDEYRTEKMEYRNE
jgi:hypothetical protein